ncbi:hypothetical protein ARSQ2_00499 [Arsenophonus endosymbiont of Bemisia tabaci Q2]|nr:hypothetical protein ARSQ2_00499 [Arsenophonus endosymbiont of Bemisia tabaci Q2]
MQLINSYAIREAVISGNWSAVNNGTCTLTDLGLRYNGNGLVWLNSGISVHEAESDTGLTAQDKQSYDYHSEVCQANRLKIMIIMDLCSQKILIVMY